MSKAARRSSRKLMGRNRKAKHFVGYIASEVRLQIAPINKAQLERDALMAAQWAERDTAA